MWEACDPALCWTLYSHSGRSSGSCVVGTHCSAQEQSSALTHNYRKLSVSLGAQLLIPALGMAEENCCRYKAQLNFTAAVAIHGTQLRAVPREGGSRGPESSTAKPYTLMWLHCFQSWALAWAVLHRFTRQIHNTPWDLVTTCKASPQPLGSSCLARGSVITCLCSPSPIGIVSVSPGVQEMGTHRHNFLLFSSKVAISWDLWVKEIRRTETHQGKAGESWWWERCQHIPIPTGIRLCYDALVIRCQTGW